MFTCKDSDSEEGSWRQNRCIVIFLETTWININNVLKAYCNVNHIDCVQIIFDILLLLP